MANPPTAGNAKKIGRRGRKRRIAGWTLLLLGLLVAGVWVASRWWGIGFGVQHGYALASNGMMNTGLYSGWSVSAEYRGWFCESDGERGWVWIGYGPLGRREDGHLNLGVAWYDKFDFRHIPPKGVHYQLVVVLWPIPLLLWTPAALLLRSGILARRRAVKGMCAKCGYSLAGLAADAPCPECGKGAKITA